MSKAKEMLLQSFNILELDNLKDIFKNSVNCRNSIELETTMNSDNSYRGEYSEASSTESLREKMSGSLGLNAEYGFYSASVQTEFSTEYKESANSFNALSKVSIRKGNIHLKNASISNILTYLSDDFKKALNAVSDFESAEKFTNQWGTHLLTNLDLGGSLYIAIQANSNTIEELAMIETKVKAAYSSVGFSIDGAASGAHEIAESSSQSSLSQSLIVIGGDANKAAEINPDDKNTFKIWSDSISDESVTEVNESIEIYTLAEEAPGKILKEYLQYKMLEHSLNNPRIFSRAKNYNQHEMTLACLAEKNYKIVSGGVFNNKHSNFIISSYPKLSSSRTIQSWTTISHDAYDAYSPLDFVNAYAIAIFDPFDLLEVHVSEQKGTNTGSGIDTATATVEAGFTLLGGGSFTNVKSGNQKYFLGSYPSDDLTKWISINSDYANPTGEAELTSFAIGVRVKVGNNFKLELSTDLVKAHSKGQYGSNVAECAHSLSGGGVNVVKVEGSYGNLIYSCYPSDKNAWSEENKDLQGHVTEADATAYAISISCEIKENK